MTQIFWLEFLLIVEGKPTYLSGQTIVHLDLSAVKNKPKAQFSHEVAEEQLLHLSISQDLQILLSYYLLLTITLLVEL